MPESPPSDAVTVSRRATVAALPLIALVGCQWGPEEDTPEDVEQQQDADGRLARQAADAIGSALRTLTDVAQQHIGLATALAPLTAAHEAHLRLLPDAAASSPSPVAETSRAALARIRREESRLQTRLAELATSAVSGTLARALASMSASIAQHLAVLPQIAAKGPA